MGESATSGSGRPRGGSFAINWGSPPCRVRAPLPKVRPPRGRGGVLDERGVAGPGTALPRIARGPTGLLIALGTLLWHTGTPPTVFRLSDLVTPPGKGIHKPPPPLGQRGVCERWEAQGLLRGCAGYGGPLMCSDCQSVHRCPGESKGNLSLVLPRDSMNTRGRFSFVVRNQRDEPSAQLNKQCNNHNPKLCTPSPEC